MTHMGGPNKESKVQLKMSGSRLSITAMCSSDNGVSSHQRPSTHQGSSDTSSEQSNLVRELPMVGIFASDNPTPTPGQVGRESLLGHPWGGGGKSQSGRKDDSYSHS